MRSSRKFGEWVRCYRNGFGRRPVMGERGPIVLRIADVSTGLIELSSPRRGRVAPKEAATYKLEQGDLLFVRVNGARDIVGRCCVVGPDVPADTIFNDHLIRVRLKEGLDPQFARICMNLPSARTAIEQAASTSAGQLTINQQILDSIDIPDVAWEEQQLIASRLQVQFDAVEKALTAARAQLRDIEALPSRLLAQAFGDLGA